MRKRLLALLCALLLLTASALADMPKPNEEFWVLDQANVLTDRTEGMIFFANQRLANEGLYHEVVIVTVDTTGEMSIGDFAESLFEAWGINEQGILLLLVIGDDDYYAVPGLLLSDSLPSEDISTMFDQYLEEDFARRDYDTGVEKFFTALFDRVAEMAGSQARAADGIADYEKWLEQQGGDSEDDGNIVIPELPQLPEATPTKAPDMHVI